MRMEILFGGTEVFRSADRARRNLRCRAEFPLRESTTESGLLQATLARSAWSVGRLITDPAYTIVWRTVTSR